MEQITYAVEPETEYNKCKLQCNTRNTSSGYSSSWSEIIISIRVGCVGVSNVINSRINGRCLVNRFHFNRISTIICCCKTTAFTITCRSTLYFICMYLVLMSLLLSRFQLRNCHCHHHNSLNTHNHPLLSQYLHQLGQLHQNLTHYIYMLVVSILVNNDNGQPGGVPRTVIVQYSRNILKPITKTLHASFCCIY